MPGPGAVEAIVRLRRLTLLPVVVLLAGPGDETTLDRALALGARGYLTPDLTRHELAAVAGHAVAGVVTQRDHEPRPAARAALTRREVEVLEGMSQGRSNAQIALDLFLAEDTVKSHARRLFRKLEAADRAQAVAIGLRRGLIR